MNFAPFLANMALSGAQGYFANQAAKRQQEQMEREAAQAKLINSFGGNAQPTPVAPQQPSMAQQLLADPLTKQLVAGLISNVPNMFSTQSGGSQMPGSYDPKNPYQPFQY